MKVDRRIRKSKNALKTALIQLMKEKDLQQITITDVVKTADLNRGTFYKHYQILEDLLEELIDDVITDLIQSFREPYHNKETFILQEMTASTIKIFDHISRFSDFYQTILHHETITPGLQTKLCNVIKHLALEDLQSTEENHVINKDLQASYQSYALAGMIIEWVKSDFKYSSKYMAEQLIHFLSCKPILSIYQTSFSRRAIEQIE
ncbi:MULTISPECIES: TetR/AcrR family transcriptional regulator [unclassified Virgibacillus]|uniref:TetR/AcrR family transcriptional regulator n=1 Tax=Virgibacillus TaxID=84406 RepID=UPI00090C63ED|nr:MULTISPECIES: TetR-like C-terminal domain-containing protein [unclassified Virgibacillus]API92128.1 TetR family transcriptional regulator [Virgibacillus sp. 6R]MBS7430599.1 TetR/AcrR family transcriptional regulator C-terminal domain-containing protein [Virgibacillus sp. 19R1-5]